jgi:hypothetical protein
MTYALDTTGLSANNLVTGETHTLTPAVLATFGYVILNNGPFFGRNLSVVYTPSGGSPITMVAGVDYTTTFNLPGIGFDNTTKIWGAIEFYNVMLNGVITVTYQALGGKWSFNTTQISQYLNSNAFNAGTQVVNLVPQPLLYLPNNPSVPWPVNSITSLVMAQQQVTSPIPMGVEYASIDGTGVISQIVSVVQDTFSKLKATVVGTGTFAVQNTASIPAGSNIIGKIQLVSGASVLESGTIATNGSVKTLFGGVTPTNGFEVINTHASEILYVSEATNAQIGGTASIPVQPGMSYKTPSGYKPVGQVTVVAQTAGHGYIGRSW